MKYKLKLLATILFLTTAVIAQEKNTTFSHFIKGITNPEDIIQIPDAQWVLVSSMASDASSSGAIYGINTQTEEIRLLFTPGKDNTANHHLARFAPHGIYVHKDQLLVINHGSREAIELFDLHFENGAPKLKWSRYISFPANVWANGLVTGNDGKIYATAMYDPADTLFLQKFTHALPTGAVWQWDDLNGWRPFNKMLFSAANGIAISPDGKYLYVAEWARRRVHKLSTSNDADTLAIEVDFMPDNIRWTKDGQLIIAGQRALPVTVFTNKGIHQKVVYFSVIKIDPASMAHKPLLKAGGSTFASATVAAEINGSYWIGCVGDNKIAVYTKK
ncbi:hypothetical protein F0L74_20170 [Chitinophaga agrisoli]|uniref:SMP-30/Gluconolactonase/LRE-like region domain-containing protein n=1 Tax=Chitinophaga agrisoli TaxID=2607653 RepID=A0A5B2VJN7_9BACT|nr:SMP-30/gluconolactonase/LRE family protein [Chitinophaga agrisoli]KAA2238542.1 hypothetical protein F0L74_20170 [Chitinophaga agrisoli]